MTAEEEVRQTANYLFSKGWELAMTEAEGCETWEFPFVRRRDWPQWALQQYETQHFWDRKEAVTLQNTLDDSGIEK